MKASGCPDDLLLRARTGAPSSFPPDRQLLDEHLAGCAVCRMSRALLDAVGPLPALGATDVALADRLLATWGSRDDAARSAVPDRRRSRTVRLWWAAAAALLLITAGASAAWYRALPRRPPAPRVASPPRPAPARAVRRVPAPRIDPPPPLEAPPPPAIEPARPLPRHAPAPPAPALFQRANQARGDGDLAAASLLYRDLQARYPAAPEARLSFFSLGEMLLDSGDARAALAQFRAYLRAGDDTLTEEALVRAARACQQLGQVDDEVSLWRRLQADFPRSDYRWRAEDRLRALRDGSP